MAIRIDKIYTKTGDNGTSRVFGGIEVPKDSLAFDCLGTLDEVNCHLGIIRSIALQKDLASSNLLLETDPTFKEIQNDLFDIGKYLIKLLGNKATDKNTKSCRVASNEPITYDRTVFLEKKIDSYVKGLKPLTSFVLPGGGILNSQSHLARAVCRRCERLLVRWHSETPIDKEILTYINRLSDFLFAYSRWVSHQLNQKEFFWQN